MLMDLGPEDHKKKTNLSGGMVLLASFAVYLWTTAPTVYLGDSGEFIASAFCLGNAHNSGYPLFALIGKAFCMIPLGSIAFRMNLMSAFFGALTAWLVYKAILQWTRSVPPAFCSALVLAFSKTFWSQTTCAEVYVLHGFFVALILYVLLLWDEVRTLGLLLVLALVAGLSFSNHMQTVMLAPAVLTLIICSDRHILFNTRHILLLGFFFLLGLSVYLYLPIRTHAGTAIHWGDPDTLSRFLYHVGAADHRNAFVLTTSWKGYITRIGQALHQTLFQYGPLWGLAVLGWIRQTGIRWKVFWILLFVFDLAYTTFLNVISLEITAFQIPSAVAGAVLIGIGMDALLLWCSSGAFRRRIRIGVKVACFGAPVVLFGINLYANDQHENYTAYEYAADILRGAPPHATLLVEGDNILFPVAYLRLVENARPDLALYDRHNLFFKMPFLYRKGPTFYGKWEALRKIIEKELVRTRGHVYLAVFDEKALSDRGFDLIPHGLTSRAVGAEAFERVFEQETNPWPLYVTESLNGSFHRDYMNRMVTGYFFFKMARDLIFMGKNATGIAMMQKASWLAYDDKGIHGTIAIFFIDMGLLNHAREPLELFSRNSTNRALLWDIWGYYYSKAGEIHKAIEFFKKAIRANRRLYDAYRNLGLMYLETGEKDKAREAFEKSLAINSRQPNLVHLMEAEGL
ncbi:MAG: DUF2723 domain-containing protein [Deltaproteobacteria bacterium]|nr:DUF2723 domain-containing protein [Deltaproteobacteria bacterium]